MAPVGGKGLLTMRAYDGLVKGEGKEKIAKVDVLIRIWFLEDRLPRGKEK